MYALEAQHWFDVMLVWGEIAVTNLFFWKREMTRKTKTADLVYFGQSVSLDVIIGLLSEQGYGIAWWDSVEVFIRGAGFLDFSFFANTDATAVSAPFDPFCFRFSDYCSLL